MTGAVLRILLIEDSAGDARLLREMLSREKTDSYELTHVVRMSEGIAHLARGTTDIVLVDLGLPDEHGLETVRRAKAAAPGVPVIVLTGLDDETLAGEATAAGAEDYLIKGQIESRALPRTLRHAIERSRLQAAAELSQTRQIQLKEEFLSHVSHELRSPLTAIHQFVSILLDGLSGEVTEQQHQYLAIVMKNVLQLRAMIDDLLELTRMTGKLIIERRSTSMTEAIAYAIGTLEGAAARKEIRLSSNPECRLPMVYADPTRLRQILITLLDNAIKFTPARGSVNVQATVSPSEPDFVMLEVSDSGCGIRPEMTELIFERQFQADPAVDGRRGLGLGLYICKELVTRQGGQVSVRNNPDQGGAVFTVTLPVVPLPDLIAPLLMREAASGDVVALVRVEAGAANGWRSDEARIEWANASRALIERCLFRTSDGLLPQSDSGGLTERSFVVAFGNERGIAVLAQRIRDQFATFELVDQMDLTVVVSYQCLRTAHPDRSVQVEASTVTTAARIAGFIHADS